MSTQTVEQVQRLAPYLEGLEKRLLQSAFGEFSGTTQTKPGLLDSALKLPQQRVAGLDPLQQQAFAMAPGMVGSYAPFISGASGQTLGAQAALGGGLGLLSSPAAAVQQYMNPYQNFVIDEINRQAQIGKQKRAAQAVRSGAFGGSRQGIMEAEAEGRRLAAIGDAQRKGFGDALTASRADLGMLSQLGETGRNFQSQVLEAQRQNQLQAAQEPFTRLEIGQNLLKGIPSAGLSSTFKTSTTPATNPFLAGIGAYTALQGIKPSGVSA